MTKKAATALVVLSGGQDSTYCAAWAKRGFTEVRAVTFNFGQRHRLYLTAARNVARLLDIEHEVIDIGAVLQGTSPLTNPDAELERYASYEQMDTVIGTRIEKTFVPMRNALFLTIAANRAACHGVSDLVTGVCAADNANYPDCRAPFIRSMEGMIEEALGLHGSAFFIHTPLIDIDKATSILRMHTLGHYPLLAFTHTSYAGEYPPTDMNHANVLRAEGFKRAGLPDPLVVRAADEGLMPMPDEPHYARGGFIESLIADISTLKRQLARAEAPK
jgi:7-cyano-7-deazaguanine synthase